MTKEASFLDAAKEVELLKEELDKARSLLNSTMIELGVGTMIQDPETKLVYQIQKPNGTFVYFNDLEYVRTKKEGEKAGTLSAKKAEEAGFVLK